MCVTHSESQEQQQQQQQQSQRKTRARRRPKLYMNGSVSKRTHSAHKCAAINGVAGGHRSTHQTLPPARARAHTCDMCVCAAAYVSQANSPCVAKVFAQVQRQHTVHVCFDLHIICAFVCQSSCRQNIYSPKPPRPHSPAMPPVFIPSSGWRHHRRHHQQQAHNAYAINTRGLTKLTSAESALM